MCVQATIHRESFETNLAFEGFLASVYPHMCFQMTPLRKGLVTIVTFEWFLVKMSPHVPRQAMFCRKHPGADFTLESGLSFRAHLVTNCF